MGLTPHTVIDSKWILVKAKSQILKFFQAFLFQSEPTPWVLTSNLHDFERIISVILSQPAGGTCLLQPKEVNTALFYNWGFWSWRTLCNFFRFTQLVLAESKVQAQLSGSEAHPANFYLQFWPLSWVSLAISKCLLYIVTWMTIDISSTSKITGPGWILHFFPSVFSPQIHHPDNLYHHPPIFLIEKLESTLITSILEFLPSNPSGSPVHFTSKLNPESSHHLPPPLQPYCSSQLCSYSSLLFSLLPPNHPAPSGSQGDLLKM